MVGGKKKDSTIEQFIKWRDTRHLRPDMTGRYYGLGQYGFISHFLPSTVFLVVARIPVVVYRRFYGAPWWYIEISIPISAMTSPDTINIKQSKLSDPNALREHLAEEQEAKQGCLLSCAETGPSYTPSRFNTRLNPTYPKVQTHHLASKILYP
jgi:hypothetical protein